MPKLTVMGFASLVSAGCLCSAAALAEKCSGYNVNNTYSSETVELAKGDKMITFAHSSVHVSQDPKSPLHMAAGDCGGTIITTPDGKSRGSGTCVRIDKDGDVYNEEWAMPVNTEWVGTWKVVSGTGKYANVNWSGTWRVILSQGKMGAVTWTGSCP